MARKCCVPGCRSNYDPKKKKGEDKENAAAREHVTHIPTFRFPNDVSEKMMVGAHPKNQEGEDTEAEVTSSLHQALGE